MKDSLLSFASVVISDIDKMEKKVEENSNNSLLN